METVVARVDTLTRAGESVEAMQARVNQEVERFRIAWPAWREPSVAGLFGRGINRLVERAWRGIRGQGG
jgi:hypothetical protein